MQLPKVYLASKSPRRSEIISNAGFEYELIEVDVEESYPDDLPAEEVAEYLARKKASAINDIPSDGIILTADTIVILNNEILGKPRNPQDAVEMLSKLSGKSHLVITGVCLKTKAKTFSFSDTSEVEFGELSKSEIIKYVDSGVPNDKAGSYGIQSGLGMVKVTKILGSYFNIMGLPIHRVYEEILKFE